MNRNQDPTPSAGQSLHTGSHGEPNPTAPQNSEALSERAVYPLRPIRVYGLVEASRPTHIRYVGATRNHFKVRAVVHKNTAERKEQTAKAKWLADCQERGSEVDMIVLPFASERDAVLYYGLDNLLNQNMPPETLPIQHAFTDEEVALMGQVPDQVIADRKGCDRRTVGRARDARGIASFQKQRQRERQKSAVQQRRAADRKPVRSSDSE